MEVQKPADTICDVKALGLVDVLAYMLAGKKGNDTCRDTRRDVDVKELVKTLPDRLAELNSKTVSDTIGHVEAEALVNQFFCHARRDKDKKISGTLRDV